MTTVQDQSTATPPDAVSALGAGPLWDPDVDDQLVCVAVREITPTVRTFVFRPRTRQSFAFRPGQHLIFAFEIDGRELLRSYSLSSPPTRPNTVSITVRRRPGGVVSSWLHDQLRPGMSVRGISQPLGHFTMIDHPARQYLLIAGGSGITPFMSMIRAMHDEPADVDVVLIHAAHSRADLLHTAELAVLADEIAGLRVVFVPSVLSVGEGTSGPVGRLSAQTLLHGCPELAARTVLTCGPEGFMTSVQSQLVELGCDVEQLHRESFVYADPVTVLRREEADPDAHLAGSGLSVYFRHLDRTIDNPVGSTVLDAAQDAGITLPSSCSQGLCGTCKSVLVSGQVEMHHGGGIRPKEIAQGKFLPCCSVPLTPLVVDRV